MMKTGVRIFLLGLGAGSLLTTLLIIIFSFPAKTETEIKETAEIINVSELEEHAVSLPKKNLDPYESNNDTQEKDDYLLDGDWKVSKIREDYDWWISEPFDKDNRLPKLSKKSAFQVTEDIPVLDGATAFYPVYAAFAQAVYPPDGSYSLYYKENTTVKCSRTENAYKNLLEGTADIIFCLEPSSEQLREFRRNNLDIKLVPIGREAFVFFVNVKNPVSNLTTRDIQQIYGRRSSTWDMFNGTNEKIIAFQRPKNSGSQTILEKIMGDVPINKPLKEEIPVSMVDIIQEVASYRNYENAIGFSFLFFSNNMAYNKEIKILSINSVKPSVETIKNKKYPYTVDFYAVYIEKKDKNKNIKPFIEWMLSKQGQELVSKCGYVPVK